MVVTEGATVTINLTNNLPTAAGNTSILFPGFQLTSTCPQQHCKSARLVGMRSGSGCNGDLHVHRLSAGHARLLQRNAGRPPGRDGALRRHHCVAGQLRPPAAPTASVTNLYGKTDYGTATGITGFPEQDFRLAHAAYDHPKSCYDREYLFQWAEMDARIHSQAEAQVQAKIGCTAGTMGCSLDVQTEPYHPAYFLINGRSMPDLMDPNYASEYPHQPYNGNPHMHPGELTLIRTIGQGRWQHPFHEHANHVRILARDGNLILSPTNPTTSLAGTLMFNTDTTPGEAFDGIFYFSGRGLNWDPYGHHPAGSGTSTSQFTITSHQRELDYNTVTVTFSGMHPRCLSDRTVVIAGVTPTDYNGTFAVISVQRWLPRQAQFTYTDPTTGLAARNERDGDCEPRRQRPVPNDPLAHLPCTPDANGYNTGNPSALNYYEWCQDHNKPVQVAPFGDVASGGPATLPDPNVLTNGQWYGGTPYLGPDASLRGSMPACDTTTQRQLHDPDACQHAGQPGQRARLGVHVALAQRARDHDQQRLPRRNADDDAGGFTGISD